jgi:hypothetical protein
MWVLEQMQSRSTWHVLGIQECCLLIPDNAIPEEIGEVAARLLFQERVFRNIQEDIKQGPDIWLNLTLRAHLWRLRQLLFPPLAFGVASCEKGKAA